MDDYPWPANAGGYRMADNLDHPWIPSADVIDPSLRPGPSSMGATRRRNPEDPRPYPRSTPHVTGRGTGNRQIWRWLKACLESKRNNCYRRLHADRDRGDVPISQRLRPADWRAYGYWALHDLSFAPHHARLHRLGGALPHTAHFPRSPRGGGGAHHHGSPHLDRWAPDMQQRHPSLPPRPPPWDSPQPPAPGQPLPPASAYQLNPFLEHRTIGLAPLYFDIGRNTTSILFNEPASAIPIENGDRAQPATYPLLTQMHICAVADDSAPTFPWPITVRNPRGITCQDVFEAIYRNFQELVIQHEYDAWSSRRREQCSRAYHFRVRSPDPWHPDLALPVLDGLRRIDYMGERVMFRGLEASPNRDPCWIMFVGPA